MIQGMKLGSERDYSNEDKIVDFRYRSRFLD